MLRIADSFSASDVGRQRRHNEDSLFARAPLFAVADGMGGAQAGEVASRTAVEFFEHGLGGQDGEGTEDRLATLVRAANARIHELSQVNADQAGMGTTMTAVYVGPQEVVIAHVGDSRCYRLRDGELSRLTDDHSLVEQLVKDRRITPEEAFNHPQRSVILRALGPEANVDVDTLTHRARGGDVYLLCSDGLTTMVNEERVGDVLRAASGLREAGLALVAEANAAGGRDNITVILFRLEEVGDVAGGGDQPTVVTPRAVPTTDPGDQPTVPRPIVTVPSDGAPATAPAGPPAVDDDDEGDDLTVIPERKPKASGDGGAPQGAGRVEGWAETTLVIAPRTVAATTPPGARPARSRQPGAPPRRPGPGYCPPTTAGSVAGAPAAVPAPTRAPPARRPRLPTQQPPARPRRFRRFARRMRRSMPLLVVLACILGVLAAGAYIASTTVYFVATNDRGLVTIYSGLPYTLPGGIRLYSQYYVSAVPASTIAPARRSSLLDHQLRSQGDASDLVRSLELGQISGATPNR